MKVLVLHPPMYPVNYDFYNYLGEYVDLTIFQVGEYPADHKEWKVSELNNRVKNFNLKIFGMGTNSFKNQIKALRIAEIYALKPDIVLSIAFWIPSFYYSLLSRILNFKFVILTNAIEATEIKYSFVRNVYRKAICKNTSFFISASSLTTDYLKSLCPGSHIRLSVQTIETKKWREKFLSLDSKQNLRKELNFPNDKIIILGVGNFYYKKNWLTAIKILEDIEDILFVLVGNGEDRDKYQKYIDDHSIGNKFRIVDRKEGAELKKYFKASDIFLLPSIMETFGFVVVEALASDLPVLCSKYAGASTLIEDDFNGYVIDSKLEFKEDVCKAILNLENLKNNAYNSVKNLSLENRAKEFYEIFIDELAKR